MNSFIVLSLIFRSSLSVEILFNDAKCLLGDNPAKNLHLRSKEAIVLGLQLKRCLILACEIDSCIY